MSDSEDRRTQIALFRYSLILPLIRGEFPPGGKDRLRQQIASRHYDIPFSSRHSVSPSTLARWEYTYILYGFDGLKPQPRSDADRLLSPGPDSSYLHHPRSNRMPSQAQVDRRYGHLGASQRSIQQKQ